MRFVAVKNAEQQVALGQPPGQALHRIRSRLIKSRTALVNEVRGLLGEFGLVMPVKGVAACRRLTGWPRARATCWSPVLTATNRIVGRLAASQMASVSFA